MATELKPLKDNLHEIAEFVKVEAARVNTIVVKEDSLLSQTDMERLARANDRAYGAHIVLSALKKFEALPLPRLIEQLDFAFHSRMNDYETPRHTLAVMGNALVFLRGL